MNDDEFLLDDNSIFEEYEYYKQKWEEHVRQIIRKTRENNGLV